MNIEGLVAAPGGINVKGLEEVAARLRQGDHPIRPFHWQLEFPEVFEGKSPGFDAIVGNPPFAGKNTVAAGNRAQYPAWLQALHEGAHGNSDLVAHFFRRAFDLLRADGSFGLIATNTISQGDTRSTGLALILAAGGAIIHATKRRKWPGEAAVTVSVIHVRKGAPASVAYLDGKSVTRISAYLVEGDLDTTPRPLAMNTGRAYQGSIVLGMGFTFDDEAAAKGAANSLDDMKKLIEKDNRNAERIFPYIGGEEVNNNPTHSHRRYVIDFGNSEEEEVRNNWPDLAEVVERLIKNERGLSATVQWWQFERRRDDLYRAISGKRCVLVTNSKAAPQYAVARLPTGMVYTQNLHVFTFETNAAFCALQSRVHELWARFFSSTLEDRLAYSLGDCFASFPFPLDFESEVNLEKVGTLYHDLRAQIMVSRSEGLTKTYNRFHKPSEKSPDILKLRELHAAMDAAVLRAYGWDDLAQSVVAEFIELPTDPGKKPKYRLSWPSDVQDEVLKRLLALNAERAEAERRAGGSPAVVASDDEPEPDAGEDEDSEDEDETE